MDDFKNATQAVEAEHKRLAALDAELIDFEREVSRCEHAEVEAIRTRAGIPAITAAREDAVSARAQLEQVRQERDACLGRIPELERVSSEEQLLREASLKAQAATDAETAARKTVLEIAELIKGPLEKLGALNRDLESAQHGYNIAARELGGERQEIEGRLRRRGRSLKAVTEGLKPERPKDPIYMLAWKLLEGVRLNQRREEIRLEQEREREEATARAKARARQEIYNEGAIISAPVAFTGEIVEALKGAEIPERAREVITERLPGELQGVELIRLVIPLPLTQKARVAIWDSLGKERVIEHVRFEAATPYGREYVG